MGNMILAASTKSSSGTNLLPLILIVVLFMLVYMTMTRRKRARQAQQMQDLLPGVRVRTTSGMYGTVSSLEGDDVMVEIAPGVNIRMMRRAVIPVPMDASTGATGPSAADGMGPQAEDDHDASDDRNPQDRNA